MKDKIDMFKLWFYKTFCQRFFIDAIKAAQDRGYNYAKTDLREAFEEGKRVAMKDLQKDWFVDSSDVITLDKTGHIVLLGGESTSEIEIKNLKSEVKVLQTFRLWKIFQETIRQKAIEKAVLNSMDEKQTLAGKMMLHNLGIQKSIVDLLSD